MTITKGGVIEVDLCLLEEVMTQDQEWSGVPSLEAPLIAGKVYTRVYGRGKAGEPIHHLMGGGTQGGFRQVPYYHRPGGQVSAADRPYFPLHSSYRVADAWPDTYDFENGLYYYYGDQKDPEKDIFDTRLRGNSILAEVFEKVDAGEETRRTIPPFFIFRDIPDGHGAVLFIGLAAPGSKNGDLDKGLVRPPDQPNNYLATFTILDTGGTEIPRKWLNALRTGEPGSSRHAPQAWKDFVKEGRGRVSPAKVDLAEVLRRAVPSLYYEGLSRTVMQTVVERNPHLRAAAIAKHGKKCKVCEFSFEATYGDIGTDFIEVHHLRPVSSYDGVVAVDLEDLAPLCSNCHRMVHRGKKGKKMLTLDEVRNEMEVAKKKQSDDNRYSPR